MLLGVLALATHVTRCASVVSATVPPPCTSTAMVYAPAAGTPNASAPNAATVPKSAFKPLRATTASRACWCTTTSLAGRRFRLLNASLQGGISAGQPASIGGQHVTVHVSRIVREQEADGARDLVGRGPAAGR